MQAHHPPRSLWRRQIRAKRQASEGGGGGGGTVVPRPLARKVPRSREMPLVYPTRAHRDCLLLDTLSLSPSKLTNDISDENSLGDTAESGEGRRRWRRWGRPKAWHPIMGETCQSPPVQTNTRNRYGDGGDWESLRCLWRRRRRRQSLICAHSVKAKARPPTTRRRRGDSNFSLLLLF